MKLLLVGIVLAMASAMAMGQLPPLVPRDLLFGNPERTSPSLSPDGKRLAWLAPDTNNVLQVWVKTIGQEDGKTVTADKRRGIRMYNWAKDNRTLLYLQDSDGDENYHIYGADLSSGNVRDYTPFQGVRAELVDLNPAFPNQLLVSLNLRDRSLFDVYRVELDSGALKLDTENPGDVVGWTADAKFKIRMAQAPTPEGGVEIRLRDNEQAPWKTFLKVGPEEILSGIDFDESGKFVYLTSSIGRDTAVVVKKAISGGQEEVIASSAEVDAGDVMIHPTKHVVEAVAFAPDRTRWTVIDPALKEDFTLIAQLFNGDFSVVSRTLADDAWVVAFHSDRSPGRFYRWDRNKKEGTLLFVTRPKLESVTLSEMKPVVITARDGLKLHSYLTLPAGLPAKNLPLVLFPHGGPWARDAWGFDAEVQWLANRGYAVLQPNFRGSTGYGKKHLNAGDKQWGLKMHDDLIDAVNWAVKEGIADPKRVGIMGGSYGGYCALAGLTYTPEVFACAVDIVGPSNLKTLILSIPPYWKPMLSMFAVRVGDVNKPEDAKLVAHASPLTYADKIVRPLLIGQGANDPRVKQAESEQIVSAIERNGGSVTYVLYPDEGHGFARPENRTDFNARAEAFLAKYLGGRLEALSGDKYPGSTAVVRVVDRRNTQ